MNEIKDDNSMEKIEYMKRAIKLAKKGEGYVHPNPLVGAVIVKNRKIISEDYHHKYGEFHAERNAILKCNENMSGAELYVTLEPCCHYGKTPPCTQAIIDAGIKTVYVGSPDSNPLVAGKGCAILREHGIQVIENFCKDECDQLNPVFFHYITTKTPYVAMKYAMTADGKLATKTGASKWITNETCRKHVHKLRHKYTAIMVGIGTVLMDNPTLNCRLENGVSPIRIICDTKLQIPLDSNICKTAKLYKTYVATGISNECEYKKRIELEKAGIEIINVPVLNEHINLKELMIILGQKGIDSILLEGGATLNYSALEAGIVKHYYGYIGMRIFGGKTAASPVGGIGVDFPSEAFEIINTKLSIFDEDILIEGDLKEKCNEIK